MRLLFLLSVSVLQLSAVSLAAPATFNIDPGRSTLVLSGDGLEAWSWGSTDDPVVHNGLSTSYAGTIVVDRDAAAGTFDITHGGLLAQDIPGFASGPPNSSPSSGNYLFFSQLSSDFFASSTFQGAIRDFSFSLAGPVVPASTSFDVSQLTGAITSGRLDSAIVVDRPLVFPHESEVDNTSLLTGDLVFAPGLATLTEVDGVETLTLPLSTDLLAMAGSSPVLFHLSGTIVATAAVPEPDLLAISAIPLLLVLPRCRRRTIASGGSAESNCARTIHHRILSRRSGAVPPSPPPPIRL